MENRRCPKCDSVEIVLNGRRKNGRQRFRCKACGKQFTERAAIASHKDIQVWERYFDCMLQNMTLQKAAQYCGISVSTAFRWRHKLLQVLGEALDSVAVSETLDFGHMHLMTSYKGNHSKDPDFTMPREPLKLGRKEMYLNSLYGEHIYLVFAKSTDASRPFAMISPEQQILTGFVPHGIFKENEAMASRLASRLGWSCVEHFFLDQETRSYKADVDQMISSHHGVATRYLRNYLTWLNLMQYYPGGREAKQQLLRCFISSLAEDP